MCSRFPALSDCSVHRQVDTHRQSATPATAPAQRRPPAQMMPQGLLLDATPASGADGRHTQLFRSTSGSSGGEAGSGGSGTLSQLVAAWRMDQQPRSPQVLSFRLWLKCIGHRLMCWQHLLQCSGRRHLACHTGVPLPPAGRAGLLLLSAEARACVCCCFACRSLTAFTLLMCTRRRAWRLHTSRNQHRRVLPPG
jgi:hypothetical protein